MSVNNLFDYATKELSQDAVLCWILNDDSLKLPFINDLCGRDESGNPLQNAVIVKRVEKPQKQKKGIDILVVGETISGQKTAFIIEDKTNTRLHGQVEEYSDYIRKMLDINGIHFILFKSGQYTFWERDSYKKDIEAAGIIGHYYSFENLLDFLINNKFSPSWGDDYLDHLKLNLPEKNWMTDLSRDTETLKESLLNSGYQGLEFEIDKATEARGDRNWGLSIYGICGKPIDGTLDIEKNYYLFIYVDLDDKANTAKVVIQYNLYYPTEKAKNRGGYIPVKNLGKDYKAWKEQLDLLRDATKGKSEKKGLGKMRVYKQTINNVDFNGDWHELKQPLNEAIKIAKELEQSFFKK